MSGNGILQKLEKLLRDYPAQHTITTAAIEVYGEKNPSGINFVGQKIREQEQQENLIRDEEGYITIRTRNTLWPIKVARLSRTNQTNQINQPDQEIMQTEFYKMPASLRSPEGMQKLINKNTVLADLIATFKPDPLAFREQLSNLAGEEDKVQSITYLSHLLIELICYVQIILGTPDDPCRFFELFEIPENNEVLEPYAILTRIILLTDMIRTD